MSNSVSSLNKRMNIVALTWPIFIEVLLRTALNTTDVFMLSGYSDQAVSAVGVITQISFFLIVVSMMVSSAQAFSSLNTMAHRNFLNPHKRVSRAFYWLLV